MGFDKEYWLKNYSEPEEMDGLANAKEHVNYLAGLLELEGVQITSLADFGFGLGEILKECCVKFEPKRVFGLESSEYAFDLTKKSQWINQLKKTQIEWSSLDLVEWCVQNQKSKAQFDLGICTSVLQYIGDDELELCLNVMAKRCRYLYLSVPTSLELKRQRKEFDFDDTYAFRRTQAKYRKLISRQWSFVGLRLLESKLHTSYENSPFSDHLFRF